MAKGKKAALRVLQLFWSSLDEDRFEAQVIDCVSIALNYAPSLVQNFHEEYLEFCKRSGFYRKPCSTRFGKRFFQACITLGLVDPSKTIFGGLCSHQFGGHNQQLYSVDIRQLSEEDVNEMISNGFYHWYNPKQFDDGQLAILVSGGTIRHTFGVFDTNDWKVEEAFEVIN